MAAVDLSFLDRVTFNYVGRSLALLSTWLLFCGGVATWFYGGVALFIGLYAQVLALAIFPFVYPILRLGRLLVFFQKFYMCGALLICVSLPTLFVVPTHLGGIGFVLAGTAYLVAGFKKEKAIKKEDLKKGNIRWI
eukprot:TRINITY_DN11082_c0_g1_i1.p2 TRINITY_DN11082_c0_g1~~TRINITY_DN11082_c0_g1_i1.p2  ORF type:complete len:136 (-),score=37.37 TRINITY_DN11082_c0_g1_i1:611-1018(-)